MPLLVYLKENMYVKHEKYRFDPSPAKINSAIINSLKVLNSSFVYFITLSKVELLQNKLHSFDDFNSNHQSDTNTRF